MRNIVVAVACSLVCACGSGSGSEGPGSAALAKTFTYDAPQAPTADEAAAAADAQSAFDSNPSDAAAAVAALVEKLAANSGGGAPFALPARAGRLHELLSAACTTRSGSTFTFTNCSVSEGSATITVNGTLTASKSGASWDITANVQGARASATYTTATHDAGKFTASAGHLSGEAGSDISGSVALNGQTVSTFALATSVSLDLDYQLAPRACVTAGTLEAKLVWTQRPAGVTVADKAVKIAWTGCGEFRVSHSR